VIAQGTLPSSTVSGSNPSSTSIPSSKEGSCSEPGSACAKVNDTIKLCNGDIKTPEEYVKEGVKHGTYQPDGGLGKCMCNQPYYDLLSSCLECFNNASKTELEVAPLPQYKNQCKTLNVPFTQTLPTTSQTAIPFKVKLGLAAGIVIVILSLVGIFALQCVRKKRKKKRESEFAEKNKRDSYSYAPTNTPSPYPPPYVHPTNYPPPSSDINIPSSQSTPTYYPPPSSGYSEYPPPPQQPSHGSQGGEADSYFSGNYR